MIKKFIICSLVLFTAYTLPAFAEDDEICDAEEDTEEYYMDPYCQADQDDEVPLDGGVSFLVGTAAIFGINKVRKNRTVLNLKKT